MPAPRRCSTPAAGKLIAQESQAMKRGHAEALMPLIARVMKASGVAFTDARPHRGDHRPRQFHRIARRPVRRPRHRAGRRQAGRRRNDADRLCRPHRQREQRASDDLSDRCAARPCLFPGGEPATAVRWSSREWHRSRKRSKRRASARRIWSATPRKFSPTAGRPMRRRRSRSTPSPRPTSPGWRGWVPRVNPETAPARPYYLRAPDAKPPKDPLLQAPAATPS